MKQFYQDNSGTVYIGDSLKVLQLLPDESVDCCITSPPYWGLRDYGIEGQIGLETSPEIYIKKIVRIFREVFRVLKASGTCWINLGDTYSCGKIGRDDLENFHSRNKKYGYTYNRTRKGLIHKNILGIPWRIAFALQVDGWILRQDIIWHKPNPMPESVTDRCTKAHEYIFLLTKNSRYYFDIEAIKEPASYNTHERQARVKESHKSCPDSMKNGIRTPKTQRYPTGWNTDKGSHIALTGRYPQIKNNESFDSAMAIMPDKRNKRSVWTVSPQPSKELHFATFPEKLIEPMIMAGCPAGGIVLDPFFGSGTTGEVAQRLGRKYIGIELNKEYLKIASNRTKQGYLQIV